MKKLQNDSDLDDDGTVTMVISGTPLVNEEAPMLVSSCVCEDLTPLQFWKSRATQLLHL